MRVGIYETNLSNKFSIFHALEYLNLEARIIKDANELENDELLILPGVGNFSKLMKSLEQREQIDILKDKAKSGQRILGICLGMQILFSTSEEGDSRGLDVISGVVKNLDNRFLGHNIKTPNIGWRETFFQNEYFEKYNNNYFYFVHQFEVVPENKDNILSYSKIQKFNVVSSIIEKSNMKNIYGIQFHPEKSGLKGIEFLNDLIQHIDTD